MSEHVLDQPARATPALADLALVALFCLLWSSAFAAAKIALPFTPPLIFLSIRFLIAGALMLGLALLAGRSLALPWRTIGTLVLLGACNNAIYLGLSFTGMKTVSSAFTAVIISTNPLLTALLAAPVLGERLTARRLAGLLLGIAGVAIVLRSRLSGGIEDWHGTVFVLLGLLSLVAGTVLFKRLKPAADLWTGTAIQSFAGGVLLLPVALALESPAAIVWGPAVYGSLAYLVVAVSIGAYLLWFRLLSRMCATAATSLHFLMPPLGLVFGWAVLGEPVAMLDLVGIVPIAIGIAMVTRG